MHRSDDFPHVQDGTKLTRGAWRAWRDQKDELGLKHLRIQPIRQFTRKAEVKLLPIEDKRLLLAQAEILLCKLYAHLPFKRQLYPEAEPALSLSTIRQQVESGRMAELDFHLFLLLAFALLRDSHTRYELPSPFRRSVAFLPFELRTVVGADAKLRFIVTKVMKTIPEDGFARVGFKPGTEVTRWGLTPIEEAARVAAQLLPGANPAATLARGAALLTLRPLAAAGWLVAGGPPLRAAETVALEYRSTEGGDLRAIHFPWGVASGFKEVAGIPAAAFSMNNSLCHAIEARNALMNHKQLLYEMWAMHVATLPSQVKAPLVSRLPKVFHVQHTDGEFHEGFTNPEDLKDSAHPEKRFAHLRIRSFLMGAGVLGTESLVEECKRLLVILNRTAPDGLILDIRGNPGGDIQAAERMLQMLTPRKITPCRFHFGRTSSVLSILRRAKATGASDEFKPWLADASRRASRRELLTAGRPLTPLSEANRIGQVYQGPVVLLLDARSYSAADIFAAGFQDHSIGRVIGVDPNTGGGGANFWSHEQLLNNLPPGSGLRVKKLPVDATMSVAVRRAYRVNRNRGVAIEDAGVVADSIAPVTAEDLLFRDEGVIRFCRSFLATQTAARVEVHDIRIRQTDVRVTLRCVCVDLLVFFLDGVPIVERKAPKTLRAIVVKRGKRSPHPNQLKIQGLSASKKLMAVTTISLQPTEDDAAEEFSALTVSADT